jgi:hypothetical protein
VRTPCDPRMCICGASFVPANINSRHCGDLCRFMSKVATGTGDECWNWTGRLDDYGYGTFAFRRRIWKAHRAAVVLLMSAEIHTPCVLHRCDNPRCVNPAHLFFGTHTDNMRDKMAKARGNHPIGSRNGQSKLTEEVVRAIRQESARGAKRFELAAKYGVSPPTISYVVLGKNWGHVQ